MSRSDNLVFGALALLGISFWFLLGFPFANHNESFAIVPHVQQMSFIDALTTQIYPVANYRPLGQGALWIGYHFFGQSIYAVELFNFVVALLAWLLLFVAMRERRVFSATALVAGGMLFAGYIYLFHFHGVFYSPLLLLFSLLFWFDARPFTRGRFVAVSLYALVATLFHPYALLVYFAGVIGIALERRKMLAREWPMIALSLIVTIVLIAVLVIIPRHESVLTGSEMLQGFIASYRMVEINTVVSVAALVLTIATAASLPGKTLIHVTAAVVAGIIGMAAFWTGIPVLLVWIVVCLVKAALLKKWWIVFVLAGSSLFPAPAATGSPTYAIFALLMCAAILPYGWTTMEQRWSTVARPIALTTVCVAAVILCLLRAGLSIPVVSPIVRPLLAEKEKTFQMEAIVAWMTSSEYATATPMLVREQVNPKDADDSIKRNHRPPTSQEYLNLYLRSKRPPVPADGTTRRAIWIGFGGETMPPGPLILTLTAPNAGEARVVLETP